MKLITVSDARSKGILREGDRVDLANIYGKNDKRASTWYKIETGAPTTQHINSHNLEWIYLWNSATMEHNLIGIPIKDMWISFGGCLGFMDGYKILNKTVNALYGANNIGIYGKQISETDYYGLLDNLDCNFADIIGKIEEIDTIFTDTPYIVCTRDSHKYYQVERYGFKSIERKGKCSEDSKLPKYLYEIESTINKKGELVFKRHENVVKIPIFPVLFGCIDDLLVRVDDYPTKARKCWTLYPSE